jgi:hypothetical protein
VGWLEDWGIVGSAPEKNLSAPQWVEGAGWRRSYTDSKGNTVQRELNAGERTKLPGASLQAEQTRLTEDRAAGREERLLEHQTNLQGKSDQRFETQIAQQNAQFQANMGLQMQQLQASIAAQQASSTAALEQIRLQGKSIDNAHTLGLAEINQRGDERKDAMTVRNEELRMSREQMQLNNQLQDRKLTMEDQHFQQQAALDHKNGRRTQVMNALTLIAQSAAKL